jgi:hypothetical protein
MAVVTFDSPEEPVPPVVMVMVVMMVKGNRHAHVHKDKNTPIRETVIAPSSRPPFFLVIMNTTSTTMTTVCKESRSRV